jgi:hypothetical protein
MDLALASMRTNEPGQRNAASWRGLQAGEGAYLWLILHSKAIPKLTRSAGHGEFTSPATGDTCERAKGTRVTVNNPRLGSSQVRPEVE